MLKSCKAAIPLDREEGGNARHIAIDGKTMRASKDSEGKAEHVLSAFCSSLQTVLGHEASRSAEREPRRRAGTNGLNRARTLTNGCLSMPWPECAESGRTSGAAYCHDG